MAAFASRLLAVLSLGLVTLSVSEAVAARRVALVIGNAAYPVGPLANPTRDAAAVATVLEGIGFDKVIVKTDLGANAFRESLIAFGPEAAGSDIAVVFYAGHGIETGGRNYLVPIDAKLARASDVAFEAIALGDVLTQIEGARQLRLVILDACRNNVFPMAGATRSVSRGLARIEPDSNTLVVYAAREGTTAADGRGGAHSPFTQSLLRHIATPALEIRLLFGRVRDDVMAATSRAQQPHVYGTLGGAEIYLKQGSVGPDEAALAWAEVKGSGSVTALEAFVRRYGDTFYGDLAHALLDDLERKDHDGPAAALLSPAPARPPIHVPEAIQPSESRPDAGKPNRPDVPAPPRPADAAAGEKPGTLFRDCPKCPEMTVIPAGSFLMGAPGSDDSPASADMLRLLRNPREFMESRDPSEIARMLKAAETNKGGWSWERPRHRVTFARPFAIGRFEVTWDEWNACVADRACKNAAVSKAGGDQKWGKGRRPVIHVDVEDARTYARWLSAKTSRTYRLPTEAEWEYAARAGSDTEFHFGDGEARLGDYAWFHGNDEIRTHPVGEKLPNAWGLHDIVGNVWEWVEDCWHDTYEGSPDDGSAWTTSCSPEELHVTRGGAVIEQADRLRSAYRGKVSPARRNYNLGFRLVRVLAP